MKSRKHRVTLTTDELWHLFWSFDGICAAGSEDPMDAKMARRLAAAFKRSTGQTCWAMERWIAHGRDQIELTDGYEDAMVEVSE